MHRIAGIKVPTAAVAALFALACGSRPDQPPGAPSPASLEAFNATWELDQEASDRPGADAANQTRAAQRVEPVRARDVRELQRRAREAAANRQQIAALIAITAQRPPRFGLSVTDSTFRWALPRQVLELEIGAAPTNSSAQESGTLIRARVEWVGEALRLERTVAGAGAVTDTFEIDQDGTLVVTRRLSLDYGNQRRRPLRFIYQLREPS